MKEVREEHHGKATKVKGRRRLEKENRHVSALLVWIQLKEGIFVETFFSKLF